MDIADILAEEYTVEQLREMRRAALGTIQKGRLTSASAGSGVAYTRQGAMSPSEWLHAVNNALRLAEGRPRATVGCVTPVTFYNMHP